MMVSDLISSLHVISHSYLGSSIKTLERLSPTRGVGSVVFTAIIAYVTIPEQFDKFYILLLLLIIITLLSKS